MRIHKMLIVLLMAILSTTVNADNFEGTLELGITDDFQGKKSEEHFYLKDSLGNRIKMNIQDKAKANSINPGSKIKVRGKKSNSSIEVEALDSADATGTFDSSTSEPSVAAAQQIKKIAAILVNLSDGTHYTSKTNVINYLFNNSNSLRNHFLKITHGQIDFIPDANNDGQHDVFGPVQLSASGQTSCDYSGWATQAKSAAQSSGVDLSIYDHIVYVLPGNTNCSWSGLAMYNSKDSWVKDGDSFVYIHEIGHNLGLRHASTDPENDGSINNAYGDTSSPTGGYNFSGFNAPHSEQMGLLNKSSGAINDSVSTGTYDIYPLGRMHDSVNGNQILKIPDNSRSGSYFYLSYRTKDTADSSIGSGYLNGVSLHASSGFTSNSRFIKNIALGQSFTDVGNGLTIETTGIGFNNEYITVTISRICGPSNPSISASPSSQSVNPSGTANYTMTIKNNDNSNCPSSTFNLSSLGAVGVSVSIPQSSVTLAPQQSATLNVSVTDMGLSSSASIGLTLSDNDGVAPNHSNVSTNISISVDSSAPTTPTNLTASASRKGQVSLSWNASSDSGTGVSHYLVYRDAGAGFTQIAQTTSLTYKDSNPSASTVSYYVIAVDAAGNKSAKSNTATLSLSTQSGGKGGSGGSTGGGGKGNGKGK